MAYPSRLSYVGVVIYHGAKGSCVWSLAEIYRQVARLPFFCNVRISTHVSVQKRGPRSRWILYRWRQNTHVPFRVRHVESVGDLEAVHLLRLVIRDTFGSRRNQRSQREKSRKPASEELACNPLALDTNICGMTAEEK